MKKFFVFLAILTMVFVGCHPRVYKMTIVDGDWMLYEQPDDCYQAGQTVVIKVDMAWDVSIVCLVNNEDIGEPVEVPNDNDGHTHLEFTFVMPEEDVSVQLNMYDNVGFDG